MAKYEYWITEEGLLKIQGWARDGLTDEQISHNIGVAYSTFKEWKKKFPDLSATLKRGKEVIDRQVENALLKAALGYEYEEDGMTKDGDVVPLRKVAHPNTTALIFWLKNRKPVEWRDKQHHDITSDNGLDIRIDYGDDHEDDS